MRVVVQRVINSYVKVNNIEVSKIEKGLNLLIGFKNEDYPHIINTFDKFVDKILNLRIFGDEKGKMNLSLIDIDGEILLVSQFTLYGDLSRGRRPSFEKSLEFNKANELFDELKGRFLKKWNKVKVGVFGEFMEVGIINSGPVTFVIDWD